jgi:hypothetical protein
MMHVQVEVALDDNQSCHNTQAHVSTLRRTYYPYDLCTYSCTGALRGLPAPLVCLASLAFGCASCASAGALPLGSVPSSHLGPYAPFPRLHEVTNFLTVKHDAFTMHRMN